MIDMKVSLSTKREELAISMGSYYRNNLEYHDNVGDITGERPSLEEINIFQEIKKFQNYPNRNLKVLEIGCGACDSSGTLLSILGAKEYYGIDASQPAIQFARQKYPDHNLTVGDAAHLPFENNFFDVVIFNFVLEHMVYPDRVLCEAIRVTRLGGIVGMIVPVCDLPWLIPSSLRYQRKNLGFLIRFTLSRWIELLRIRYQPSYYSFRLVEKPIILIEQKNYQFQPDDDLVYIASSLEIIKYLINSGCEVLYSHGREITTCIRNGRRPLIDWLKLIAFNCLRFSLVKLNASDYTTTISLVVRKVQN